MSEALHALSHGYHNISDIAYELAAPPPRQLMAQSLPIYHQAHSPAVVVNQTLVRQLVDSGWMCVVNQTLVTQLVDSGWMCVVNQTLVTQLVDSGWMCVVSQTLVRQLMEGGWWLAVCEIERGSTP